MSKQQMRSGQRKSCKAAYTPVVLYVAVMCVHLV